MKKNIKHIIREQLNDKMRQKFMVVMSKMVLNKTFNDDDDSYYELTNAFHKTKKLININFSSWSEELNFMDYVMGCFIQTGHSNIKDPSFVTQPKKQVYEFNGGFLFSEGGYKEIKGELEGYSMTSVKTHIEEDGMGFEFVVDENISHSEYFDYDVEYNLKGSVVSESKENGLTKKDEKINHYIEYYKNLSPDGFNVKRGENNEIIIELPK